MKPWIKILIGVACGFAGGFAAGFFSHKKMNDIQFQEISEEEMKEIEDKIQNSKKTDVKDAIDSTFKPPVEEIFENKELPDDPDKLRNALQGKTPYIQADKDQKTKYEQLWNATKNYSNEENANDLPTENEDPPGPDEENFDEGFLEMIENEEADPGSGFVDPPHVISLVEFYNERPEFDKITIEWYEPDNVWVDDNEEIIHDISSYVGMINVDAMFAENGPEDDPDVRFVRNEQYGTDYEIIRHHRSLAETTGGVE